VRLGPKDDDQRPRLGKHLGAGYKQRKGLSMNPLQWRKMTWVLNIWNVIFLIWIIAGVSDRSSKTCEASTYLSKQDCIAASDAGTTIGVGLIIFLWFLGFVVLGLVWFMTRRRDRMCPVCGEDVKRGATVCKSCGHDFAATARPAPSIS